jgi:hypothetical protein
MTPDILYTAHVLYYTLYVALDSLYIAHEIKTPLDTRYTQCSAHMHAECALATYKHSVHLARMPLLTSMYYMILISLTA